MFASLNDLRKRVSVTFEQTPLAQPTSAALPESKDDTKDEDSNQPPWINTSAWYSSPAYKSLFSSKTSNPSWITDDITRFLDSNYNRYEDTNLLKLISNPPDSHPYSSTVKEALLLFNEWRSWKNLTTKSGGATEWKLSSSTKYKLDDYNDTHLRCYWNTIPHSSISATKGEMIVPFPVPLVCGVIENSDHECQYEEYSEGIHEIACLSQECGLFYAQTKSPMFLAERDLFGVAFNYVLPNAEIVMGCRSVSDDTGFQQQIAALNVGNKEYVRGFYTLDLYHLRPWYERNSNYTVITYYSHLDLNGSVPNWIVNGMISDTPKIIVAMKEYIEQNLKVLAQPGQLHIPLKMLEYIGIYPDEKTYRVKGEKKEKDKMDHKLQYAYNDEDLSVPDTHETLLQKEELQFVSVSSKIKSENKRYQQRSEDEQFDDLQTPVSTPDLQAAAKGQVIPMMKAVDDGYVNDNEDEEYKFNVDSDDDDAINADIEHVAAALRRWSTQGMEEEEKMDENVMEVISEDVADGTAVGMDDLENDGDDTLPAANPSYCGYFSKSASPENVVERKEEDKENLVEENVVDDLGDDMNDGDDTLPTDNPSYCGYFSKSASPKAQEVLSEFEEKTTGNVEEKNIEGGHGNENADDDMKHSGDIQTKETSVADNDEEKANQ